MISPGSHPGCPIVANKKEYSAIDSPVTSARDQEDDGNDGKKDDESSTPVVGTILAPFAFVFSWTIPPPETRPDWYFVSLVLSIAYIAAISEVVLAVAEDLSLNLRIPTALAGCTLLALGAEIPDTFSSMSMAKNGMGVGAISSALGSQIINITRRCKQLLLFQLLISSLMKTILLLLRRQYLQPMLVL